MYVSLCTAVTNIKINNYLANDVITDVVVCFRQFNVAAAFLRSSVSVYLYTPFTNEVVYVVYG